MHPRDLFQEYVVLLRNRYLGQEEFAVKIFAVTWRVQPISLAAIAVLFKTPEKNTLRLTLISQTNYPVSLNKGISFQKPKNLT